MSITKLQQYQMSGSLASDISDSIVRSDLVKENRTIADDLNSLRTQVKGILGEAAWTDEQAVSLSQVYTALHVAGTASEFQGAVSMTDTLSVAGESTLASAIVSDLTQNRVVFAGENGALIDDSALTFDGFSLTVGATDKNGNLNLKNSNGTSTIQIGTALGASTQLNLHDDSQNLAINNYVDANSTSIGLYKGVTKHVDLYVDDNGGIIAVNGASGPNTIELHGPSGAITAQGAVDFNSSLDVAGQVDLAASGVATSVRGTLNVAEETTLASAIVSDLTDTRVVFAGASGALIDDAAFTFGSNTLTVGGPADGVLSVKNASDAEIIKLDGQNQWVVVGNKNQPNDPYAQIEPGLLEMYDAFGNRAFQINGAGYSMTIGSPSDSGVQLSNYDDDLSASALVLGGHGNQSAIQLKTPGGDQAIKLDGSTGFGGKIAFRDSGNTNPDGPVENKILLDATQQKMAMFNMNTWSHGSAIGMISYDQDTDASVRARGYAQFLFTEGAFPGGENKYIRINEDSNQGEITGLVLPTVPSSAANKEYVDGYVNTPNLYLDGANGNATFAGNIQVDGDFRVKGSMTYIDTQHVRVEDAFIYLATGSLGTTDSGIVLHGGAGVGMDLAIAQKGGSGEFIFGKGDRQPDGEGSLVGMELVPAKFAGIKLGSAEDALSGSVSISGDNIKVAASAAALVLEDAYRAGSSYSGDFKLAASSAEWTAFQTQYPGKSLLGAIGAGGGVGVNFRKKVLMGDNANFSGNTLDIAAAGVGTLRSTAQADADYGLDIYLNGVLLALGAQADYTVPSTSTVSFNYAINSDDVLTIIAKNVA